MFLCLLADDRIQTNLDQIKYIYGLMEISRVKRKLHLKQVWKKGNVTSVLWFVQSRNEYDSTS